MTCFVCQLKLWQNSKTQIVTKLKNSNCDKIQKILWWQNSNTQIVTKLQRPNCNITPKLKLSQTLKNYVVRKSLTLCQLMRCTQGSLLRSPDILRCFSQNLLGVCVFQFVITKTPLPNGLGTSSQRVCL